MSSAVLTWSTPVATELFSRRSLQEEVMDDPRLPEADYRTCLADLAKVNRVTRTHQPIIAWLAREAARCPGRPLVVVDVGSGQGDLLRAIARWANGKGIALEAHGIDRNPRSVREATAATDAALNITFHAADIFEHVLPRRPDFIVSSQVAHHLTDDEARNLVRWLDATALRGWFIADVKRSAFAFYGFPILCRLAGWHDLVRRDGQVSIARAFSVREWRALLADAGVCAAVDARLPFRVSISSAAAHRVAPRRVATEDAV